MLSRSAVFLLARLVLVSCKKAAQERAPPASGACRAPTCLMCATYGVNCGCRRHGLQRAVRDAHCTPARGAPGPKASGVLSAVTVKKARVEGPLFSPGCSIRSRVHSQCTAAASRSATARRRGPPAHKSLRSRVVAAQRSRVQARHDGSERGRPGEVRRRWLESQRDPAVYRQSRRRDASKGRKWSR